jgi:hypothetical protein
MHAQDLDECSDREADAAYGDHRHDAVADPPTPGIGVIDVGDGTDAGRESHEGNDRRQRHDR